MSRVGKTPIEIPDGVNVELSGQTVVVSGPKGTLEREIRAEIRVEVTDGTIALHRSSDAPFHRALHGLSRTLIANMVEGVTKGFRKVLEVRGIGYRAAMQGESLNLQLGYSHPILFEPPSNITIATERIGNMNVVTVEGIDKELVGQTAAVIRGFKPPEPYKGKGIRYRGEYVRKKAGKTTA